MFEIVKAGGPIMGPIILASMQHAVSTVLGREIPREEFGKSVFLVEPDGTISRGAEAVFKSLAAQGTAMRSFVYLEMMVFVGLLLAGYIYVVKKGALKWD